MKGNRTADTIYDVLGIGLGPFNLGLACLMAPVQGLSAVFLERKSAFSWHDGMMIPGTTLQNNFMADLVTLADPTSPFTYLNYCKLQGKIYRYYFRENFYLTRQEYNRYCRWAAAQLDSVHYEREVTALAYDENDQCYVATVTDLRDQSQLQYRARRLVVGIGSMPSLPACVGDEYLSAHTGQYLRQKASLQKARRITVIGSGQSGAEIYYDLLHEMAQHDYELYWITRSSRFFQMETGKLTLELITPDYAEHFYKLDAQQKHKTLKDQVSIFNGINTSLIERIYDELDEQSPAIAGRTHLYTNMALTECSRRDNETELVFEHAQTGERYRFNTDEIVFATGYCYRIPDFMQGIASRLRLTPEGRYQLAQDYAVDLSGDEVYIQNAGFDSHGLTNPDLGLNCFRNARIINAIMKREVYAIDTGTTFQAFTPQQNNQFFPLSAQ
ncbi:lysine N(6)-hydroxylase/L-ornithine N(5)-oxygenase family protein [Advenella mimigardefordensis]|uniref:Alcaligin biosynthesis enzyme n=1 Tax=Advenella mimigardefordensis (strain DSM 17166 / LMG 22922 / DPN7) TaxID=1247726 RepID=W0PGC9_ADVMD|nr:SidA/IucD/PvdA family monooxygenase [Advenella mimigardefordensis]AHG64652.1 alcaligin biosynthesis enzyme [Advenella mimigardefordensis DPN7]